MGKPASTEQGGGGRERILVFIPMYNCARQIGRVLGQFGPRALALIDEVLVVDNGSTDGGPAAAAEKLATIPNIRATVVVNDQNYNLGGSHKVAFEYAMKHGFDTVIVLHGDDQANLNDLVPLLESGAHAGLDSFLGSRFMKGAKITGYSLIRDLGNRVYNWLFTLCCRRRLHDLGSGLNLYRVGYLADRFYIKFPDALTFNYYMVLAGVHRRSRFAFFPITWREEDQRSNVKLVRQGLRTLAIPVQYLFGAERLFARNFTGRAEPTYTCTPLAHIDTSAAAARV